MSTMSISKAMENRWDLELSKVKSTACFLLLPAMIVILPLILGIKMPKPMLYGLAVVVGIVLLAKSAKDPEWLIAVTLLYIPLAKQMPASVLPGINGTNMLLLMLLGSRIINAKAYESYQSQKNPFNKLVFYYALFSCFSVVTMVLSLRTTSYFSNVFYEYKAWVDMFVLYFIISSHIKNGAMARRVVIYMALGCFVVLMLGAKEMLERSGYSSIEKMRVKGPQSQPNDFGSFLVYNIMPILGYLMVNFTKIRPWLFSPYILLLVKVLITTYSRGAYLGLVGAVAVMGYVRGLRYIFLGVCAILFVFFVTPSLLPESIMARFSQTTSDETGEVDKSSHHRLILWKASIEMTLESPVLGKGFKMFPYLKSQYTEEEVKESDNHNMYLYISSNMGIPALILILSIIIKMFFTARKIYKLHPDPLAKSIGLGGCGMSAAVFVINMFGSRLINIETCGYVWVYIVVLGVLKLEVDRYQEENCNAKSKKQ